MVLLRRCEVVQDHIKALNKCLTTPKRRLTFWIQESSTDINSLKIQVVRPEDTINQASRFYVENLGDHLRYTATFIIDDVEHVKSYDDFPCFIEAFYSAKEAQLCDPVKDLATTIHSFIMKKING